jgi:DNA-binding transcriptional ArsR family regulator
MSDPDRLKGDADIAAVAGLIGESARATLLLALTEVDKLPATELAARARIAPSTASEHLGKLVAGRLLVSERRGRHHYYRLADPAVARALEALALIAPATPVRSLRDAARSDAIRCARTCYDHLAGRLGVELAAALERDRVLVQRNGGYVLGRRARKRLGEIGIDLHTLERQRRASVRLCLDWSERRPHVAGAFGAALATRLFELGWIKKRAANRSVEVTTAGHASLREHFGVEL